jgi:DNA-binding CsgD family transcriptional regulator
VGATVAAVGSILALVGLEFVTPPNLPLGAAVLALVVVASLVLDPRLVMAIVALAVAGRAVDAALGDISAGLATLEAATFVVGAGAALLSRRYREGPVTVSSPATNSAPRTASVTPSTRFDGAGLTDREREVIVMAMQGLTAAQVAERLYISKRTVETHLERAYAKLGVRSKRELIASAFDEARLASRA